MSERRVVQYVPTAEDRLELRRFLHRRLLRHPLVLMLFAGALCLAAGGAMMAAAGSALWAGVVLFGVMVAAAMWLARHGSALQERYPDRSLIPLAFRWCAMRSAQRVTTLPPKKYGAGLLDVAALLDVALPAADALRPPVSDAAPVKRARPTASASTRLG